MKFYRAKIGFDDGRKLLVKNELITEREIEKYFKNINMDLLEIVEIKKNNTYKFFGARFGKYK